MKTKDMNAGTRHLAPALSLIEAQRAANAPCVTRAGFADMLRVSVRTVDRIIAAQEIPVHRVRGKMVRILRSDAERYLNGEKLKPETLKAEISPACPGHTSSDLKQPSPGALRHPLPFAGRGTSPQSGEGHKNLKTTNQTGELTPESSKPTTQK
jgi:excisionase family DNA binding protein